MKTVGSLCTGYGGLEMGLGLPALWHAENDPHAARVLKRRYPGVPNLGDVTAVDWSAQERPDILLAGFPCQAASVAGKRKGRADARWLWPAVADAISALRPPEVFIENVPNLRNVDESHAFHDVLSDLARLGYASRWTVVGACAVGLAHHRHRLFLRAVRAPGQSAPELSRWPMAGRVVGGRLVAEVTPACGAPPRKMKTLPTPRGTDVGTPGRRSSEGYRPQLGQVVLELFPTPDAGRFNDGENVENWLARREALKAKGINGNGMGTPLAMAVQLLPTPTARDGMGGPGHATRGGLNLRTAVQPEHFDRYEQAVRRHVATTGELPPPPTEANGDGAPRLSAAFAEWLMDLPAGWVTDELDRLPALARIGNGVVPRQATHARNLLHHPA